MIHVNDNLFGYMPDWTNGVTIRYRMATVTSQTRKLKEQRKPLLDELKRRMTLEYWQDNCVDKTIIENFLKYYRSAAFYVPIPCEPITITDTGDLSGGNSLNITDAQYFYNYKNLTDYVMLYDLEKSVQVEKIGVISAGDTTLGLSSNIVGSFDGAKTIVYPLMACILSSKSMGDITDTIRRYTLDFEEIF